MNAIEMNHLSKRFDKFALTDISFSLPTGTVMGLIGENGAGKSTTIKLLLGLLHADSGSFSLLGLDPVRDELEIKRRLGVVSEVTAQPLEYRARDIGRVLRSAYPSWNDAQFIHYLKRFNVDPAKKCKDLSKGMRMKLSIACALCHNAELLILDEPTSGLDPIVRDEVLDILRDFMQDERHSILLSSHITSDLEKIADNITFLHEGRVLFSQSLIDLQENYGVLRCSHEMVDEFAPDSVYAERRDQFGSEVLVHPHRVPAGLTVLPASIEQIMLFLTRSDRKED
jgi:ABC-2 type transport system ATP-binding protein